jgi:hypothetical protein
MLPKFPALDRYTHFPAVTNAVALIKNGYDLYKQPKNLHFQTPYEINRISKTMSHDIAGFYKETIN